ISASDLLPPSTRFDSGHETNAALASTSVPSTLPSLHIRMYFAAVAPPYPPPTTTTLPADGPPLPVDAQPATAAAAPAADTAFRNSRRCMPMAVSSLRLLCGEPARDRIDLRVRVALRELGHDRA